MKSRQFDVVKLKTCNGKNDKYYWSINAILLNVKIKSTKLSKYVNK